MRSSTALLRRVGGMFHPADSHAAEILRKIPQRGTVAVRVLRKRNPEQLALYWRVLDKVVESTGKWRTPEELHLALKVATGRVDIVRLLDGRLIKVPDSVAFDQMSQDEFQAYMDAATRILCDEVLGGLELEELLA